MTVVQTKHQALPVTASPGPVRGMLTVWRWELVKLSGELRVRGAVVGCLLAPFIVVVVFAIQSAVPQDTLFGQWVHTSGFALPLVLLSFAGQWVLPLLTSLVAGDVFSSEDTFGTWKTVLTRSRSRWQLFVGKLLAALTYTLVVLALLTAAAIAAGALLGNQPLVGLSGQLVPPGHALRLVAASWAIQAGPMCGYCAVSVLVSIASRNSLVGIGVPAAFSALLQIATLVNMPVALRAWLLSTPFSAWHGLWTQDPYYQPVVRGLLTCTVWFLLCTAAAWAVFRRRSFRVS